MKPWLMRAMRVVLGVLIRVVKETPPPPEKTRAKGKRIKVSDLDAPVDEDL